jgi:hypothetical protein
MSTMTIATISTPAEATAVRWEPCRAFLGDDAADGMCEACGWPSDDHELATAA